MERAPRSDALESGAGPIIARLAAALAQIGTALRSGVWRTHGPRGLSPTQVQTLAALQVAERPLQLTEIARHLAVTAPTASEAVATLVGNRLVGKTKRAGDGRAVAISLSARGRIAAGWPPAVLREIAFLSPTERGSCLRSLVTVIRALQRSGELPACRMCASCQYFRPYAHPRSARPHHCAFVEAAFADAHLRLECRDDALADQARQDEIWCRFARRAG